jgi:hypothetical protein
MDASGRKVYFSMVRHRTWVVPSLLAVVSLLLLAGVSAPRVTAQASRAAASRTAAAIPRTADGKPNLQGIWRVENSAAVDLLDHGASLNGRPGRSVVDGGSIPYQPWAAARQAEHYANRATADPMATCFLPGVPRIMYLDYPFHIFQTRDAVAITFEWSQVFRVIHVNGTPPVDGIEFWMGDSRGRWQGDTLVVNVTNHNDKTWFDAAGNFHSEQLKLEERFTLRDADTLQYDVTVDDPKVFTRAWKMSMPLYRQKGLDRILEYQCQAEVEEAKGDFERDTRTWYPKK